MSFLNKLLPLLFIAVHLHVAGNPGESGEQPNASVSGTVPLPAASPSAKVMAKRYQIVSTGGVLSTIPPVAVVWIEGKFPESGEFPTVQMVQKDFTFEPALLPIRKGTRVTFPNMDDEYHNVFSYSPAKRFDLGRYLPDERPVPGQSFDKAGMVTIRCDIHEHMRAVILVIDSPHFVLTDAEGNFHMDGIPAGEYVLKAWINSHTTLQTPILLEAGKNLQVALKND